MSNKPSGYTLAKAFIKAAINATISAIKKPKPPPPPPPPPKPKEVA